MGGGGGVGSQLIYIVSLNRYLKTQSVVLLEQSLFLFKFGTDVWYEILVFCN